MIHPKGRNGSRYASFSPPPVSVREKEHRKNRNTHLKTWTPWQIHANPYPFISFLYVFTSDDTQTIPILPCVTSAPHHTETPHPSSLFRRATRRPYGGPGDKGTPRQGLRRLQGDLELIQRLASRVAAGGARGGRDTPTGRRVWRGRELGRGGGVGSSSAQG